MACLVSFCRCDWSKISLWAETSYIEVKLLRAHWNMREHFPVVPLLKRERERELQDARTYVQAH